MAVEKRNPLPAGAYLIVVQTMHLDAFREWLDRNRATVEVLETKPVVESTSTAPGVEVSTPVGAWFGFRVSKPTQWEGPGWPDIATEQLWKEYGGILDRSAWQWTAEQTAQDIADAAPKIGLGLVALATAVAAIIFAKRSD
jgi:hypothetical protein